MPHLPRWYQDRLWVLESGRGGLGYIDLATGRYESVLTLPGFFHAGWRSAARWLFVGLSQVRETAVFGGVPIAEKQFKERTCGVWVVNLQTAETVAFVKLEDAVQEIFAVEVGPNRFAELVNEDENLLDGSFELPDDILKGVPPGLRSEP